MIMDNRQFFAAAPRDTALISTERREALDLAPSFLLRTPGLTGNLAKNLTITTNTHTYSAQSMGTFALPEQELSKFTA
jgi:hypothetical protein